jgi:hypothetical protein
MNEFIGFLIVAIPLAFIAFYGLNANQGSNEKTSVPDAAIDHPELKSSLLEELSVGNYTHQFHTEIVLKNDEILIISVPHVSYCEERVVGRRGSSGGVSFRVARGLWLRTGSFGSKAVQEITELDMGEFVITSQRLIFVGNRKLIEYPLAKILCINASKTQLAVARSGKQKIEYFVGVDSLTLRTHPKSTVEPESLNILEFKIHGEDIKALVQMALDNQE